MAIAIVEEHLSLAETVSDFLAKNASLKANRQLLEAEKETLPPFWSEMASLGWLGLHLGEDVGGSGFGIPELVVVVEEFGRGVAPGPFVPTVIASAVIAAAGSPEQKAKYLSRLADGSLVGGVGLVSDLRGDGGRLSGAAPAVLGGALAGLFVVAAGDDVALVEAGASGVDVTVPANTDPSRRAARVSLSNVEADVISGAGAVLRDLARTILAAEATGVARGCTDMAAGYAKVRHQFGRPIGGFQAVKHHCANMVVATQLATAATWDAAQAALAGGEQLHFAAATAAALAVDSAARNSRVNIQVHGGIGYTWEHDAHLFLRRALALAAQIDPKAAAEEVAALTRAGVRRSRDIVLPPAAETYRPEVRTFVDRVKGLDEKGNLTAMLDEGYAIPNWPKPWGRAASPIEQLVIEQEFAAANISKPAYSPISAYVSLTVAQHGTAAQVEKYVVPFLRMEHTWCQLFSEPDAGSDAAGIKTRGTKVDGGWLVNGQKLWTTGAQEASYGLATVRTNTEVPKHKGITMMVIDMAHPGVTIRPLRQLNGSAGFNEIFFNDVFVADDDIVGPVDAGWTVARATLGNESITVGGLRMPLSFEQFDEPLNAHADRLDGGLARYGRFVATVQANQLMNLRSIYRALAGSAPGPEGAITKISFSEGEQEAANIMGELVGVEQAYLEGDGDLAVSAIFGSRGITIGGGTSEIKRNQIGELILGLPREQNLS